MDSNESEKIEMRALEKQEKKPDKAILFINLVLLIVLVGLLGYNQINVNNLNSELGINGSLAMKIENSLRGGEKSLPKVSEGRELTGDLMQDSINLVISSGAPNVYGTEMGVTFDDVQGSINIMKQFDPYDMKPRGSRIIPTGDDLQRYIDVNIKISCEYCCGAASIIRPDGQSACGCAHSMAMRGLTAYLIQYHPEMSNDEILRELARWKGLYFPKQMIKKMTEQLQSGQYTSDIAALLIGSELPSYGEGNGNAPLPSEIEDLPAMVGGC